MKGELLPIVLKSFRQLVSDSRRRLMRKSLRKLKAHENSHCDTNGSDDNIAL